MAISLEHKSITIDVNNRNAPNVVAIANVNDKAVRYLDVTLTASGNKLTFTDCTATATFATDGYLISDSVACTINSAADVITVPLENFKSMSGFLAIEIKIANGETQVLNTPLALKVKVTPSLLDKSMINKDSAGTTAEICREVATARGKYDNLNARLNGIDSAVTNKAEKSTVSQLSARMQTAEKALTGKANTSDVANALKSKEDNSNKVSSKTDITDSRVNYPSIEYLDAYYYKANELYSSEETDKLLGDKTANDSFNELKNNLLQNGFFVFDSYPYEWMHAIKDIRVTDGSTIAIGYVKRTSTKNAIVLYLVENGALSTAKLYATVNSDITGYATYANSAKTITMTVNWDEIPYDTVVQFNNNYVLCSAWCYGNTRLEYLLNKAADNKTLNERLVRMDMSIGSKYDSSNIELGTATLTPYSTQIDKIKSATCLYEKIGDIVIVNVTVIMNATSLGGTSAIALLNMPFSNKSDAIVHDIGISKNGGMFRGSVNKSAWLQFTPLNKQAYNFVADEQVNFSLIYKI